MNKFVCVYVRMCVCYCVRVCDLVCVYECVCEKERANEKKDDVIGNLLSVRHFPSPLIVSNCL